MTQARTHSRFPMADRPGSDPPDPTDVADVAPPDSLSCNHGFIAEQSILATVVTQPNDWVLLSYRIPREPSTPRIAVWRKLRRLGVAQLGDGMVALPADARTVEHLEWIAEEVIEADGSATVWTAQPTDGRDGKRLRTEITEARNDEYRELLADMVGTVRPVDSRTVARWRRTFSHIQSRDYFGANGADAVRGALADLAAGVRPGASREATR